MRQQTVTGLTMHRQACQEMEFKIFPLVDWLRLTSTLSFLERVLVLSLAPSPSISWHPINIFEKKNTLKSRCLVEASQENVSCWTVSVSLDNWFFLLKRFGRDSEIVPPMVWKSDGRYLSAGPALVTKKLNWRDINKILDHSRDQLWQFRRIIKSCSQKTHIRNLFWCKITIVICSPKLKSFSDLCWKQ